MYKVFHSFPTGEWGSIEVDTLCAAEQWFQCKLKAKNNSTVTLYVYDTVLKRVSR